MGQGRVRPVFTALLPPGIVVVGRRRHRLRAPSSAAPGGSRAANPEHTAPAPCPRKKPRSARLLGCKRPRNGSRSLPPFSGRWTGRGRVGRKAWLFRCLFGVGGKPGGRGGGAERRQWRKKRGGSPVSKGVEGSRLGGHAQRPLRTAGAERRQWRIQRGGSPVSKGVEGSRLGGHPRATTFANCGGGTRSVLKSAGPEALPPAPRFSLSKKWLAPLFRGFHTSLAPTARPGSYVGKPLLRKAFCGFAVHPPGGLLLSLRDNSPCAAKSDESLKGLRPPNPPGVFRQAEARGRRLCLRPRASVCRETRLCVRHTPGLGHVAAKGEEYRESQGSPGTATWPVF